MSMTPKQKKWLDDNPAFEVVRSLGPVPIYGYTEKGYLLPRGIKVDGERRDWGGLSVITTDTTLHTNTRGAVRVGRRYHIV